MSITELLERLDQLGIVLSVKGDELIVRGKKHRLEPSLVNLLRENKQALIEVIQSGSYSRTQTEFVDIPPNPIPAMCTVITPSMLPLVDLTQEQIDRVVATVPGGAANVQDIYPLAPLQGSVLFHSLMSSDADVYLNAVYSVDSVEQLENLQRALQAVIDRHDILRTAVLWEDLPEPVQLVWRRAPLEVDEVSIDAAGNDAFEQLQARFDRNRYRMDVRVAPLMRVGIARDERNGRWLMLCVLHHLAGDRATVELLQQEVQAHLLGQAEKLQRPVPFRNFVAQSRLGVSRAEHETFFRELLRDVDEPTRPYELCEGRGHHEAELQLDVQLARRVRACARGLGVTAASIFHVAFARVLARLSSRSDVVFGSVLLGRMQGQEGSGQALGLFINALPVRIKTSEQGVAESVRQMHAQLTRLLRHEHAPLALVQRCSEIAAPAPLFNTLLNYRHSEVGERTAESPQAAEGIAPLHETTRSRNPLLRTSAQHFPADK